MIHMIQDTNKTYLFINKNNVRAEAAAHGRKRAPGNKNTVNGAKWVEGGIGGTTRERGGAISKYVRDGIKCLKRLV